MSNQDAEVKWGLVELRLPDLAATATTIASTTVTITADRHARSLLVTFATMPTPALVDLVVDLLASIWPAWLAPLGATLDVAGGATYDHGQMALRVGKYA